MSMTEFGSSYSFLSNAEKTRLHQKPYYVSLVIFVLTCAVTIASCIPLWFPSLEISPLFVILPTALCCINTVLWSITVKKYIDMLKCCYWENLNSYTRFSPSVIFCITVSFVLPLFCICSSAFAEVARQLIDGLLLVAILVPLVCIAFNAVTTVTLAREMDRYNNDDYKDYDEDDF